MSPPKVGTEAPILTGEAACSQAEGDSARSREPHRRLWSGGGVHAWRRRSIRDLGGGRAITSSGSGRRIQAAISSPALSQKADVGRPARAFGAVSNAIQSHILRPNSIRASPGRRKGTLRPIDGTDLQSIAPGLMGACGAESAHSGLPTRLATLYVGRSGATSLGAAIGVAATERRRCSFDVMLSWLAL